MKSDYEIKVLKEINKGNSDPVKISLKTEIPVEIVMAVIEEYRNSEDIRWDGKRIEFTKRSAVLFIDVIILYIALRLLLALMGG